MRVGLLYSAPGAGYEDLEGVAEGSAYEEEPLQASELQPNLDLYQAFLRGK